MRIFYYLLLAGALISPPLLARPIIPEDLHTLARPGECQVSPDGRWIAVQISRNREKWRSSSEVRIYPFSLGPLGQPYMRFPNAHYPRWSPDGSRLLYWGGDHKGSHFYLASVGPRGRWPSALIPAIPSEAEAPVWAPDGRHLAMVIPSPSPAPRRPDSGRLYDDLFVRRWNHYYDGRRRHLAVADLEGHWRDVTPGDWDACPTSGTYSSGTNFCFSPDSRALLLAAPPARGQAHNTNYDVYRLDLTSGAKTNLTAHNRAADLGPRLSADGKRLYIVSHLRPGYESDFGQVRWCPIDASGKPIGDWQPEGPHGVGEFRPTGLSRGGGGTGGLLYTIQEGPASAAHWLDARGRDTPLKARGGPRGLGSLHSISSNGRQWAGIFAALDQPPGLCLGDLKTGQQAFLPIEPLPSDIKLGQVESLEVAVEGARMQMWLIKPPDFTPQRRWPLAFLVHGGPQGGWNDDWSLRWNAQAWAAQGYVVAMPNPRGSSGQTPAYQEEVSRDWGGRAYNDLMAGADFLATLPYIDSQRMVAAGASYGGYMINWIAVHTDRFRALVTHCGVWNLESMYGTSDEIWFSDWEFGGPPWGDSPDYSKFSPHKFAPQLARFKTPHLVIHNDLDFRVPINQGLELYTALQLQGVKSKFLNFPDEGHHVTRPANSLRWYREVFTFLREHNHQRS